MPGNAGTALCFTLWLACVSIAPAGLASAQVEQDVTIEEALQICAAFSDAQERLLCFEELASANAKEPSGAQSAKSAKEEPADRVASRRNPSAKAPATENEPSESESASTEALARPLAESETLTFIRQKASEKNRKKRVKHSLTVYRTWKNAVGELRIAFTNGEIWRQIGEGMRHEPEPGDEVVFKPMLFGSWVVSFDDGRYGIRMHLVD